MLTGFDFFEITQIGLQKTKWLSRIGRLDLFLNNTAQMEKGTQWKSIKTTLYGLYMRTSRMLLLNLWNKHYKSLNPAISKSYSSHQPYK